MSSSVRRERSCGVPAASIRNVGETASAPLFGSTAGTETYGRLGVIYTGDRPAVEVLEILAPIIA